MLSSHWNCICIYLNVAVADRRHVDIALVALSYQSFILKISYIAIEKRENRNMEWILIQQKQLKRAPANSSKPKEKTTRRWRIFCVVAQHIITVVLEER